MDQTTIFVQYSVVFAALGIASHTLTANIILILGKSKEEAWRWSGAIALGSAFLIAGLATAGRLLPHHTIQRAPFNHDYAAFAVFALFIAGGGKVTGSALDWLKARRFGNRAING